MAAGREREGVRQHDVSHSGQQWTTLSVSPQVSVGLLYYCRSVTQVGEKRPFDEPRMNIWVEHYNSVVSLGG